MDCARRVLSARIYRDRPGPALIFPGGKEGHQAKQNVSGADQASQSAFGEAVAGEELGGIGVAHLREFGLDFSADRGRASIRATGDLGQLVFADGGFKVFPEFCAFVYVQHIENWFFAEEHEATKTLLVL